MNLYTHTIVSLLSIYFAYKVGRKIQKRGLVEEIANDTLNKLEKIGAIQYAVKDGETVFQLFKNKRDD